MTIDFLYHRLGYPGEPGQRVQPSNCRPRDQVLRCSATPARSRRLEGRIEELTSKLTQESKEKIESTKHARDADKTARELRLELTESERQRLRLQEEMRSYEEKVLKLRNDMNALVHWFLDLSSFKAEIVFSNRPKRNISSQRGRRSETQRNISREPISTCFVVFARTPADGADNVLDQNLSLNASETDSKDPVHS